MKKRRKPYRHKGTSSSMTPKEAFEDRESMLLAQAAADTRFRDGGRAREWLDQIAAATLVSLRPKSVPADVLEELRAAGFVRVYGRGRSHGVVATKEGLQWLR